MQASQQYSYSLCFFPFAADTRACLKDDIQRPPCNSYAATLKWIHPGRVAHLDPDVLVGYVI